MSGVPGVIGAADPAAMFGDDEAEVHPQPAVGRSGVRPHVGAGLHHGELNLHGDRKRIKHSELPPIVKRSESADTSSCESLKIRLMSTAVFSLNITSLLL